MCCVAFGASAAVFFENLTDDRVRLPNTTSEQTRAMPDRRDESHLPLFILNTYRPTPT